MTPDGRLGVEFDGEGLVLDDRRARIRAERDDRRATGREAVRRGRAMSPSPPHIKGRRRYACEKNAGRLLRGGKRLVNGCFKLFGFRFNFGIKALHQRPILA